MRIRKFNPETMKEHPSILICGAKRTGKSRLLRYLLYVLRKRWNLGFMLHGTRDGMEDFKDILPSLMNKSYTQERFHAFWKKIMECEEYINEKKLNLLMGLDDCTYDKKLMRTKDFRELMFDGRHARLTPIICSQYCMDMGPEIRTNFDYIFLTRQTKLDVRKKLREYFFGMLSQKEFDKVLDGCTKNYEVLVVDQTQVHSNNPEDCLFYYKAELNLPEFKLFDDVFWKLDEAGHKYLTEVANTTAGGTGPIDEKHKSGQTIVATKDKKQSEQKGQALTKTTTVPSLRAQGLAKDAVHATSSSNDMKTQHHPIEHSEEEYRDILLGPGTHR